MVEEGAVGEGTRTKGTGNLRPDEPLDKVPKIVKVGYQ
jgi:hypothetical protein